MTYERYLSDCNTMGTFCGDVHMVALADIFNRPIYCYQSFLDPNRNQYENGDDDLQLLQLKFQADDPSTREHRIYLPFSKPYQGRKPIMILNHQLHFTALIPVNDSSNIYLPPNTNVFAGLYLER